LLGILPIFRILLELMGSDATEAAPRKSDKISLGMQVVILTLVILVRGSALPLLGAIVLLWLALAWRQRRLPGALRVLVNKGMVMGLVGLGALVTVAVSVPSSYLREGRFGTVIWMRVTESLGVNPAWPFPGVNDMFDCRGYVDPPVMRPSISDANGACMFVDYIIKHKLPAPTADGLYGNLYETAMREAFFKIAARYPGEVLKTFAYYKPLWIVQSIKGDLRFDFQRYPRSAIALLLGSLGVVLFFFSVATVAAPEFRRIAGVTLLSALFTLPAYLAAWAAAHTSADLLLYCLFAAGMVVGSIIMLLRAALCRAAIWGGLFDIPPRAESLVSE
jgi:hypothetical protein